MLLKLTTFFWVVCLVEPALQDLYYPYDVCNPRPECQRGYVLPHPTDCHIFRVCTGAQWKDMDCNPELLFDYEVNNCVWHERVKCWSDEFQCDSTIPPLTGGPPICPVNETCLCPGDTDNCTENMKTAHRYDCTKYYLCLDDRLLLMDCAPGLYFNIDKGECTEANTIFECIKRCPTSTIYPSSQPTPTARATTTLPTRPPVFPSVAGTPPGSTSSMLIFIVIGCIAGLFLILLLVVTLCKKGICGRHPKIGPNPYTTA